MFRICKRSTRTERDSSTYLHETTANANPDWKQKPTNEWRRCRTGNTILGRVLSEQLFVETNHVMFDTTKTVGQKISLKYLPRILHCIFLTLIRTVTIWLHCCPPTFSHRTTHNWDIYHVAGQDSLKHSHLTVVYDACQQQPCDICFHIATNLKLWSPILFFRAGNNSNQLAKNFSDIIAVNADY
jgi:hypothetical protein